MQQNDDMSSLDKDSRATRRAVFVERVGLQVESSGWMPRMSGRMLGLLLVSEHPITQTEIREELLASAGAISAASRELIAKRLARRVSTPGSRPTAMELHPEAWRSLEEDGLRVVHEYSALATEGLDDFEPGSNAARNLERMRDYFAVVEERMQHVLEWLERTAPRR